MPNYSHGKIYKLVNDVDDLVYIGSTTQPLHQRLGGHRSKARGAKTTPVLRHFNTIGWDTVRIILVEAVSCANKTEMEQHERRHYDLVPRELRLNAKVPQMNCPHGRQENHCVPCGVSQFANTIKADEHVSSVPRLFVAAETFQRLAIL